MTLVAKREELAAKQQTLAAIFKAAATDQAGVFDFTNVKDHGIDGDSAKAAEVIRAKNAELEDLHAEVKGLAETAGIAERVKALGEQMAEAKGGANIFGAGGGMVHPGADGKSGGFDIQSKSLGELFVEGAAYKSWSPGQPIGEGSAVNMGDFGMKTLFQTSAGWAPQAIRTGKVVDYAAPPIEMLDLVPSTTTDQNAVVYMEETTLTNAAAETAQGGSFPEAALALTQRSVTIEKIPVYLPVTDEQLEDISQAQAYINNRLTYMVKQRLGSQIVNGDGNTPNIKGYLNASGLQTQAKGADPVPDAILKAIMTKVGVTGQADADAVVMHPTDIQNLKLLRTADGIYIWGNPSDGGPMTIWGLPIAKVQAIGAGTALVGAFGVHSELAIKRNLTLAVGYVNDDFIKGRQAIRADMRAALVVYRGAAFCKVTGL